MAGSNGGSGPVGIADGGVPGGAADVERIELDTTLYSQEAIFRTSYKFTDRAYLFLSRNETNNVLVEFRSKDPGESLGELVGAFLNELIDQQIRVELTAETQAIREWIVAQAFVESDLPQPMLLPDQDSPVPVV